jgi:N-glycosylase/DNA lyase
MKIFTPDFNLEATLESGQVFGFRRTPGGAFEGTLYGHRAKLRQVRDRLLVESDSAGLGVSLVKNYFDLEQDLTSFYTILRRDKRLIPLYRRFKGLRIIRQEAWEALACFILSSNNNVKRIQRIWRNLADYFGKETLESPAVFPKPLALARSHERVLRFLGLGYRAPFLYRTAHFLAASPQYLGVIREAGYAEAKTRVLEFPGIGEKVADCVLLYGFQKYEAFPVDVWIARAMKKLYFKNRPVPEKRIRDFARNRWGERAGYVQQYLFHGARLGVV